MLHPIRSNREQFGHVRTWCLLSAVSFGNVLKTTLDVGNRQLDRVRGALSFHLEVRGNDFEDRRIKKIALAGAVKWSAHFSWKKR